MQHMETIALRTHSRRLPWSRRRSLEAAGWRTWVSYTENHRRDANGRLIGLDQRGLVELEHFDGEVLAVEASSQSAAWAAAWAAVGRR